MKNIYDIWSNKVSKIMTNDYSTSFSFSSRLLSKDIRNDIYAIYGLVRLADEIVDSFHHYDKEKLLLNLKKDYQEAIDMRISLNPILNSFQSVYHKYNFDSYLVEKFFESMEMDLKSLDYDFKLYDKYIHGSAEVVGLMCLKVFVKGDEGRYSDLKYSAMKLGSAFQKVNFLRDIEYDNKELGRIYFPDIDIVKMTNNQKTIIIKDIENDFKESLIGLRKLDKDSFFGVYVAYVYYRELLKKIKKTNISYLYESRIRISNLKKISLVFQSAIKVNLGLI